MASSIDLAARLSDVVAVQQEILAFARSGDVVIAMGAGSIGAVPAQVMTLQNQQG